MRSLNGKVRFMFQSTNQMFFHGPFWEYGISLCNMEIWKYGNSIPNVPKHQPDGDLMLVFVRNLQGAAPVRWLRWFITPTYEVNPLSLPLKWIVIQYWIYEIHKTQWVSGEMLNIQKLEGVKLEQSSVYMATSASIATFVSKNATFYRCLG